MRILIVDDVPGICEAIEIYLKIFKYDTFTANTTKQAVGICKYIEIDCIVTDLRLKKDDQGYDLIEKILANGYKGKIVTMTDYDDEKEKISEEIKNRIDLELTKPFLPSTLGNWIKENL